MASQEVKKREPQDGVRLTEVQLEVVGETLRVLQKFDQKLSLECKRVGKACKVCLRNGVTEVLDFTVTDTTHLYRAGPTAILTRLPQGSAIVTTSSQNDASELLVYLETSLPSVGKRSQQSVFNLRTDDSSAKQYFQFYGYLSQQQNMLQDYVRTGTYQSAMLQNTTDFKNKVVLDVGAGTGVLSFFALQAGARKVYAIEASNMAAHCRRLVKENHFEDRMTVISGKVEEVDVPEKVDMIISEPMGYMLFNERMLETYLHAKKWLKPGGNMFPTKGILYAAPFTDEALYLEQFSKANFWMQNSFHGIDVSCLKQEALEEYFKQPVLDTFDVRIVMAKPVGHMTDFLKAQESDLLKIQIPLQYKMWSTGMVHGLAFWFDCVFCGSEASVWLSTAPFQPLTHWYQIRLLLPKPIFLHKDQEMTGHLVLIANERQSYDVFVELSVPENGIKSQTSYDLKNPNFRYMTTPPSVPGTMHTSPSEAYFQEAALPQQQPQIPQADPANSSTKTTTFQGVKSKIGNSAPPPSQNQFGVLPMSPQMQGTSPSQSLNPAAPQFVPLPTSAQNGILSTPGQGGVVSHQSNPGFHPSTAMYVMGSQQVIYSQSPQEFGGHRKYQGAGDLMNTLPQFRQNYNPSPSPAPSSSTSRTGYYY